MVRTVGVTPANRGSNPRLRILEAVGRPGTPTGSNLCRGFSPTAVSLFCHEGRQSVFTKYINTLGNAEAEWALEVLEMHDNDEEKAKNALRESVERLIADNDNLTDFDKQVDACCFASRDWWFDGIARLRTLGKYPVKEETP